MREVGSRYYLSGPQSLDAHATFRITGSVEIYEHETMSTRQQDIDDTFSATRRFAVLLEFLLNEYVEGFFDIQEIPDDDA